MSTGPMTVTKLAAVAGVNQRYLREWLSHQAIRHFVQMCLAPDASDVSSEWILPL
jgi:hypothetical protein